MNDQSRKRAQPPSSESPSAKRARHDAWSVVLDANGSKARHSKTLLTREKADALLAALSPGADCWREEKIKLFGKEVCTPRLAAAFGEQGMRYKYSGRTEEAAGWGPLLALKQDLEQALDVRLNFCHANLYRNGQDCIAWHADDEPGIVAGSTIVSVSLGAERDFVIRRTVDRKDKVSVKLAHGSVLTMEGSMQEHYQHSVPRRKRVDQARVNLTFRLLKE